MLDGRLLAQRFFGHRRLMYMLGVTTVTTLVGIFTWHGRERSELLQGHARDCATRSDSATTPINAATSEGLSIPFVDERRGAVHDKVAMNHGGLGESGTQGITGNLVPPSSLAGFWQWTSTRQLEVVTSLQIEKDLPVEISNFLRSALHDQRLDHTIRNNIANALLNQESPLPGLLTDFMLMIQDPTEPYAWREYAVQHLAVAIRSSPQPSDAVLLLKQLIVRGDLGIPGTAALHLHRLDREGLIELDATFSTALVNLMLSPDRDLLSRMTTVSICHERFDESALPALRAWAQDPSPSLRRVAIAALGGIGCADDQPLVAAALGDSDPTVARAAQSAIEKFSFKHRTTPVGERLPAVEDISSPAAEETTPVPVSNDVSF